MLRPAYFLALLLLLGPVIGFAGGTLDHSPAFTALPELAAGARHRQLHYWIAERWYLLRALVWRNS